MEYAAELPAEVSETTSGEFRECRTRFAIKLKARTVSEKGRSRDHGPSRKLEVKKCDKKNIIKCYYRC